MVVAQFRRDHAAQLLLPLVILLAAVMLAGCATVSAGPADEMMSDDY
jgi:hypothetical protein